MILMIGIGNIGLEYQKTRHNVGFDFIDKISSYFQCNKFDKSQKFKSNIAEARFNGDKIILTKPNTFVNETGLSVGIIKKFYKLNNENIFVFYDDVSVPLGKVKISSQGSSGGHNGIKSITNHIGSGYNQIRFGLKPISVGLDEKNPQSNIPLKNFVLGRLTKKEQEIINTQIDIMIENIDLLLGTQDHNKKSRLIEKALQKVSE